MKGTYHLAERTQDAHCSQKEISQSNIRRKAEDTMLCHTQPENLLCLALEKQA